MAKNTIKKTTKKSKQSEPTYRLTPKGIFWTCLHDAVDSLRNATFDDHQIALAWELFENRMSKQGYVDNPNDAPCETGC